jgi:hypothetical protein
MERKQQGVSSIRVSGKKVYQKPQLEVYGGVGEITRGAGTTGKRDNPASDASKKTHV